MKKEESNHDRLRKNFTLHQNNLMLEPDDLERLPSRIAPTTLSKLLQVAEISTILKVMAGFVIAAIIVVALYVGKEVLIPLALSILFGFLLDPLVSRLKKLGLPKIPAIAIVVLFTLGVLGGAGTYLISQLGSLSQQLPQYQDTITQKLSSIKNYAHGPSVWDGAIKTINNVEHSIEGANASTRDNDTASKSEGQAKSHLHPKQDTHIQQDDSKVQKVQIVSQNQSIASSVFEWGGKVLSPLATAGIVFVFVVLILLDRKDLHDRLLRLFGANLNVGTDALNEAANRIGKYLRMQLVVNMTYGVPMAIGLLVIGVPAAIMWGMVAVVMRFVPYVGPIISALFPITLAFAVDPGWDMVLWTVALILILELITNNIIEPWLYGESTGLSTLAIMVSATFWTAIWGPIGLILSTPLTACILVLSNYIPALGFVKILIGSTPALNPPERFYQRLVADDIDAALDIAKEYVQEHLPKHVTSDLVARRVSEFYDEVAIPAIRLFSNGHHQVAKAEHRLKMHHGLKVFNRDFQNDYPADHLTGRAQVYCIGGRWEVDINISAMLAHCLQLRHVVAINSNESAIQMLSHTFGDIPHDIGVICISLFHPEPMALIRLIHYRINEDYPNTKIIFATWNCDAQSIRDEVKQRFNVYEVVDDLNELLLTIDALLIEEHLACKTYPIPENESERVQILHHLDVLNQKNFPIYEQFIEEIEHAFDVTYAQISWVDTDWVYTPASPLIKSGEKAQVARSESICTHLIVQEDDLLIEDLRRDPRFRHDSELRKNHIRFYAAVPLKNKKGVILGGLCLLDRQPRQLSKDDIDLLHELADDLMSTISNDKKRNARLEDIHGLEYEPPSSLGH